MPSGPDNWRSDYPAAAGTGLCPRGSALGELLNHRRRILTAQRRQDGRSAPVALAQAYDEIAAAASEGVSLFVGPNIPCEQMIRIAAWCGAWAGAKLAFAVEPAEWDLLAGLEAAGCDYLDNDALGQCDGFLIIGDAFAANPTCARAVFDRRQANRRTPIVVIDAAAGTATKFATHRLCPAPGGEVSALAAVAGAAGVQTDEPAEPGAAAAGAALAKCSRLGVIIAAEYGRGCAWDKVAGLAAALASARGGGVAAQTSGAGVLAAVRIGTRLGAVSPGEALADEALPRVAVGCDLLGMLGWSDGEVLAAAAALPNRTTAAARIVLPVAMAGEMAGQYLLDNSRCEEVSAVMSPPAGVPSPEEIVAALAAAAGVSEPGPVDGEISALQRAEVAAAAAAGGQAGAAEGPVLLLRREAAHGGCGELTGHGQWQQTMCPTPEAWFSSDDAEAMSVREFGPVEIRVGERSIRARARFERNQPSGVVVLSEGLAEARALAPCRAEGGALLAVPPGVTIGT